MEILEDSEPQQPAESWRSHPAVWFVSLMVFAVVLGISIPAFYNWTDSDQSRPSPLLWQVPIGLAIASVGFCCMLPWLPVAKRHAEFDPAEGRRFSIRFLLTITMVVAIGIALALKFPAIVAGIVFISAFGYCAAFFFWFPKQRLAVSALLICMVAPHAWLLTHDELGRLLTALPMLFGGMPTFLPGMWLAMVFGAGRQEIPWVAYLLTATEVMVGLWMIQLGPKRTIAYLLLVLQVSLLSSLVFHMLVLA